MNTPNGQKVQIMLEELHEVYGTEWTQTLMYAPFQALQHIPNSEDIDPNNMSPF